MGVVLSVLLTLMFKMSQSELAPEEDQGIVLAQVVGAPTATSHQMLTYAGQVFQVAKRLPEYSQMFQITGVPTIHAGIGGVLLKPWAERPRERPPDAARPAGAVEQDCGRARRGFSVSCAAGLPGPAGAVRDHHHGAVREPLQGRAAGAGPGAGEREVLFPRLRSEARPAAGRQSSSTGTRSPTLGLTQQDVGTALGAGFGRRLCQLFLDRRPLLQSDSAGAAG